MSPRPPPLPSRPVDDDQPTFTQKWHLMIAALREIQGKDGNQGGGPQVNAPSIHVVNNVSPNIYVGSDGQRRRREPMYVHHGERQSRGNFWLGLIVILAVLFFVL